LGQGRRGEEHGALGDLPYRLCMNPCVQPIILNIYLCQVKKLALLFFWLLPILAFAQGITRTTYHDAAKKNVKEVYQVKDTISNILQGRYISYFLNGNIESKGQFVNNETTGAWEFYFETGNLRMKGILRANSNYGLWEYFYESGQKSMEGTIDGKLKEGVWKIYYENGDLKETGEYKENNRTGLWKMYFEDGTLRGEIEYKDDYGRFIEYFHSGKVMGEGPKAGARNVGLWRFFSEDGTLESEGNFENGKKNGEWKQFYPSGKLSASGWYTNDLPSGRWSYFFEDGTTLSGGEFVDGKKNGYWSTFNKGGSKRSEITYQNGVGEYREYYQDGKLRVKGQIVDEKNQGKWQYYFQDGKIEGECTFDRGKGTYSGFFPNGSLQTKGQIEDDLRVGTWELYEPDGKLAGYYKPFYEDKTLANEVDAALKRNKNSTIVVPKKTKRKGFNYFAPLFPEYHGVIVGGNPVFAFIGSIPLSIEFYNQERLGHEFAFEGLRDPFFTADAEVPENKVFQRGNVISVRQKFYNPLKTGMWYFGHQVRFTNISHFNNVFSPISPLTKVTASASEQRAEWGVLLGLRLMERNNGNGFTIDIFGAYNIGFRSFDVDDLHKNSFSSLNQSSFSTSSNFGINFGYSFSFDGRR